jgi:predicted kinase
MEKDDDGMPMIVKAHQWNQNKANKLMEAEEPVVVIANTNTQRWEFEPYLKMAEIHGYKVERKDLFDAGLSDEQLASRNVNGVTADIIARMRNNYVKGEAWQTDNPLPPWER